MHSYVSNIWKEIIVYTIIYAKINANIGKVFDGWGLVVKPGTWSVPKGEIPQVLKYFWHLVTCTHVCPSLNLASFIRVGGQINAKTYFLELSSPFLLIANFQHYPLFCLRNASRKVNHFLRMSNQIWSASLLNLFFSLRSLNHNRKHS